MIAVGPWIPKLWSMLGLPDRLDVHQPDGGVRRDAPMWTYWYLQEGEIDFPPSEFVTADGRSVGGAPRRQRAAAPRPRRAADHRRAVGRLLQARPRGGAGRCDAAHRRARVRGRPLPDRHGRGRIPRHVVRGARRTASSASPMRARATASCARAASARSRRTTSRSSTTWRRESSSPPTPTTATR